MSLQASTSVKVEGESSEKKLIEEPNKVKIEEERPQSPDNNCPICLGDLSNKSFTNSCLHPFCYSCITEWAKIKAECPLCKQRFTSIIHNIRSISDYDEQPLEQRLSLDSSHFFFNLAIQQGLLRDRDNLMFLWSQQQLGAPTFTAPPTTPEFRRGIYRQGLWVRTSSSDRRRQCSPEFYRNNPAQTHRLIPWLTRELNILLHVGIPVHNVCSEIIRLTTLYPITSPTFKRHITSYLGPRTDHFLHEFYNFAIAAESNMHLYDFNSVYASPPYAPIRRRVIPRPFRDFLNLTDDVTTGEDELIPVNRARARNSNQGSSNDSDPVIVLSDDSDTEPAPTLAVNNDDSDVEVLEILPPRSSRPCDVITIDSDSDDDVKPYDLPKSDRSKKNRRFSQDHPRPSTSYQADRKSKRERKSSTSSIESIPISKKKVLWTKSRHRHRSSSLSSSSSTTRTSDILSSLSSRESSPVNCNRKIKKSRKRRNSSYTSSDSQYNEVTRNQTKTTGRKLKSVVHKLVKRNPSDSDFSSA